MIANRKVTLEAGEYHFNNLLIESSDVKIEGKVILHVQTMLVRFASTINKSGDPNDLLIIAYHPSSSNITAQGQGAPFAPLEINAHIISEYEVVINTGIIRGAITAEAVRLSGDTVIKGDISSCEQPDQRTLQITPRTGYALSCDDMPIDVQVLKFDGTIDTDFSGSLAMSPSGVDYCWGLRSNGQCSTRPLSFSNGKAELFLSTERAGEVAEISAEVVEDTALTDTAGPFMFAPYGFRVVDAAGQDPVRMVAGKPTSVYLEAVADTGARCEIIEDYDEKAEIRFDNFSYNTPSSGTRQFKIQGKALPRTIEVTFKGGRSTTNNINLNYGDAGVVNFTVEDPDWEPEECSDSDCDNVTGDWQGLKGTATVYSRPLALAMCNFTAANGNKLTTGVEDTGFAYVDEAFSYRVKPVVWNTNLGVNVPNDANGSVSIANDKLCALGVTPNFFATDGVPATWQTLFSSLSYPPRGDNGNLPAIIRSHDSNQNNAKFYQVDGQRWDQSGDFELTSSVQGTYLGMAVNPAVTTVGRFYPRYLSVDDFGLTPPTQQGGMIYMDQPFTLNWDIKAHGLNGSHASNYYLFDQYQSGVGLAVEDGTGVDLSGRINADVDFVWQPDTGMVVDGRENVTWRRDYTSTTTTIPDGPFREGNTFWSFTTSHDAATARSGNRALNQVPFKSSVYCLDVEPNTDFEPQCYWDTTPDIRYGRMQLYDVVVDEAQTQVVVPLRTEYWNGDQFVLSSSDSASMFDGDAYHLENLQGNGVVALQGDGSVLSGESFVDAIRRVNGLREQVRLWLCMGAQDTQGSNVDNIILPNNSGGRTEICPTPNKVQPWLRYNWRELGDESPSSVITFGSYRGNDRVIFRGERGLVHQAQ
uniref:DUF6701 domain-containing protein n=1 Tax=Thaumasiovibrio occultus TaxID=1891184 RepID=UPI00131E80B1|nr:DUF6701 domain-containing protein [Thaumasiovibrio occultus]